MTWFSSRKVTSFNSSIDALRSMRMTAPLMNNRSPALSVMFMAGSLQSVADELVDLDHRRQVVRLAAAHAINLLVHPDADRDDSGSELLRQLVVGVLEVGDEDHPQAAKIVERIDPLARLRALLLGRAQHRDHAIHRLALARAHRLVRLLDHLVVSEFVHRDPSRLRRPAGIAPDSVAAGAR